MGQTEFLPPLLRSGCLHSVSGTNSAPGEGQHGRVDAKTPSGVRSRAAWAAGAARQRLVLLLGPHLLNLDLHPTNKGGR